MMLSKLEKLELVARLLLRESESEDPSVEVVQDSACLLLDLINE